MLEILRELDASLLLFFNHLNNPVFDFIFYWFSSRWVWIPFYAAIAWIMRKDFKNQIFIQLICIAMMITISDQLASSVLKNWVMRLRPCHDPAIANQVHLVNNECGGLYGFVSSHASNSFALACFISFQYKARRKNLKRVLWTWAGVVSFSRIYLGAHFPGDVLCGAILGVLVAILTVTIYNFYKHKFINPTLSPPADHD